MQGFILRFFVESAYSERQDFEGCGLNWWGMSQLVISRLLTRAELVVVEIKDQGNAGLLVERHEVGDGV